MCTKVAIKHQSSSSFEVAKPLKIIAISAIISSIGGGGLCKESIMERIRNKMLCCEVELTEPLALVTVCSLHAQSNVYIDKIT